jgi:DNA-directed RNA polymerase subunit RPC12/RpoP
MNKCIDCGKEVSDYRVKRCKSCSAKLQIKLGIFGNKGKHFTTEHKQKISETRILLGLSKGIKNGNYQHGNACQDVKHYCFDCKCEITRQAIRCSSCETKRQFKLGILNTKRENHGCWNNGSSFLPYTPDFTVKLKEQIRKRDDYQCQNCSMTEEEHLTVRGQNLHVHHIDYNKDNCSEDNLITVCFWCNIRANANRDYWKNIYKDKISVITEKNSKKI